MAGTVKFGFSARNEEAQKSAKKHAAVLVSNVSEETRSGIRALIVRSIRTGIPPLEAAREIRRTVGLTSQQSLLVDNYRAGLVASGLSQDKMDKSLDRFTNKKLRQRSEMIARTEIMGALNAGSLESWKQAQKQGILPKNSKKKFIITRDEKNRACPICLPVDKQERPFTKPFVLGNGRKVQFPPAHPSCRCTIGDPSKIKTKHSGPLGNFLDKSEFLETSGIRKKEWINTTNELYKIRLDDGNYAFWKPVNDSWAVTMMEEVGIRSSATSASRELASSRVGDLLNANVPVSARRSLKSSLLGRMKDGVITESVDNAITFQTLAYYSKMAGMPLPDVAMTELLRLTAYDLIIGQTDRHDTNLLVKLSGKSMDMHKKLNWLPWVPKPFAIKIMESFNEGISLQGIDHDLTFANPDTLTAEGEFGGRANADGHPTVINDNMLDKFWWKDIRDESRGRKTDAKAFRELSAELRRKRSELLKVVNNPDYKFSSSEKTAYRRRLDYTIRALETNRLSKDFETLSRTKINTGRGRIF